MKGIMFDFELGMHQAFLLGYKTVTRREGAFKELNEDPDQWMTGKFNYDDTSMEMVHKITGERRNIKSRYKIYDTLFVKEPVMDVGTCSMQMLNPKRTILYKYPFVSHDGILTPPDSYNNEDFIALAIEKGAKWKNKMYTGATHARNYLKIADLKIERLNDISDEDAMLEGIMTTGRMKSYPNEWLGQKDFYQRLSENRSSLPEKSFGYINYQTLKVCASARQSYFSLIEAMHGEKFIQKNPWIFRYEFTKETIPAD